jgi:hypothetical protein
MAETEGSPCGAEPTNDLVVYGDVVECDIGIVGDSDQFRFPGNRGESVVIVASRRRDTGAPCVELFGPDGSRVARGCGGYSGGFPRIDATLEESGTYTVVVSEYRNDAEMDYTLVLDRVAPGSNAAKAICPGCTREGEVNPVGDMDGFLFKGRTGDGVSIQAAATGDDGNPCVELFAPDGSLVAKGCSGYSGGFPRVDAILDQKGIYTVLVSEYRHDDPMPYSLTYQCFGVCPSRLPRPDLEGYEFYRGKPSRGRRVCVYQPDEEKTCTKTNSAGHWQFNKGTLVKGKTFKVRTSGSKAFAADAQMDFEEEDFLEELLEE